MITLNVGKVGQSRSVQDPRKLFEAAEGKYHDSACDLSAEQRYPKVGKASDKSPFVVRGRS